MATYEAAGHQIGWWDYRIILDGATYFAIPGDTSSSLSLLQNANNLTLLQAAYDALPATGGTIWIDGDILFAGTLALAGTRKAVVRNNPCYSQALGTAYIQHLDFDSNAGDITDHYFEGIMSRQIDFDARGTNEIRNIYFKDQKLNTADAYLARGIILDSDGNAGEFVDGITFDHLMAVCGNNAANTGSLLTVVGGNSGVGNSLWHITNQSRITATAAGRIIHIADGGYLDRLTIDGQTSFEPATGAQVLYYVETQTNTLRGGSLKVRDCTMEFGQNATLFQTGGVSAQAIGLRVSFLNNEIAFTGGTTVTISTNPNTNWLATAGRSGFQFKDNEMINTGGAYARGTPGAHADFPVRFLDNPGYNPVGNIATPYPAGAGFLLDVAAAQAFPTSAADYEVAESPKQIVIGGGTITSVNIDGVATGQAGAATIPRAYYLKPEQIWNVAWTIQPTINGVWAQ